MVPVNKIFWSPKFLSFCEFFPYPVILMSMPHAPTVYTPLY